MRRASLYNTFSASLLLVCSAWLSSCVSQIPLTKEKPVTNSTYQVTSIESDSVRTVNRISRKPIIIKEQTLD